MPTIQSLVKAQQQVAPDPEFSSLSHDELHVRLERLSNRVTLYDATEAVAKIGHYEWNFEYDRLESCSEEYAKLFNMTVEETLASQSSYHSTLQFIHPEDRDDYKSATDAMCERKSLEIEFRILLADGTIKHVREFAVTVLDNEGVETGSFGLMQDISMQVRYERDLENRDELARQSEEITDIGHFIYDEESQSYIYLSEGCARIQGNSVDHYMGNVNSSVEDVSDIIDEDRQRVADEYHYYLTHGGSCAIEYRINRSDGEIRWVRELGQAKVMKKGRVSQTFGVMQDITDRVLREQELSFKEAMASQAEEITDIGYFLFDVASDCHQFVSQGQARIVGMGVAEFHTRIKSSGDYIELIYPPDRDRIQLIYRDAVANLNGWQVEYRVQRPDGELRWVREIGKTHKRNGNRVEQTIGVTQDITEQKKIEQELLYKDALANQAEAITEIGHFVYDEIRQQYLYASPGLARIFGMQVEDMLHPDMAGHGGIGVVHPDDREMAGHGGIGMVHPDDRDTVEHIYDLFLAEGIEWQVDYRLKRADGEVRWVREMGKTHLMSHGIPEQTIGVLQDITAQKNAEQEIISARDTLEQQVVERTRELANTVQQLQIEIEEREKITAELHFLANHDALTGLPSLRLCKDRLDQSLAEARRNRQTSAVMFLDLDGFKEINDRFGHEFGDCVLRETAERITHVIRETDTVARIGGDEFVIILSSLPENTIADRIAQSLVNGFARPVSVDGVEVSVSASIGIALYPDHGETAEELIRSADKAMYGIKRVGKNSFGFANSDCL